MKTDFEGRSAFTAYTACFLLVVFLSLLLILLSLKNIRYVSNADEGYYLRYAAVIGENGPSGFPGLVAEYIRNPKDWVYPAHLRAGFIVIASLWLKVTGYSFQGLSYLSLCCHGLFLIVSFLYGRKYFGEKIALLMAILLAFLPLQMMLARRALSDSMGNLCGTRTLWLFFDLLEDRSRLKFLFLILIYALTILIRESSVVLSLVFITYLLVRKCVYKIPGSAMEVLSVSLIPMSIVGVIYICLAGGIGDLAAALRPIYVYPENRYVDLFGAGPWFRYVIDFLLLSPWTTILATGFIGYTLAAGKEDRGFPFFLTLIVVELLFLSVVAKNVRYALILDMPLRLFAVLMVTAVARKLCDRYAFPVATLVVLALAVTDYVRAVQFFSSVYDPVTFTLLKAYRIVPY